MAGQPTPLPRTPPTEIKPHSRRRINPLVSANPAIKPLLLWGVRGPGGIGTYKDHMKQLITELITLTVRCLYRRGLGS